MIDIHSHFLWGMDDGAESIEQSLAMLKMAAESGTTDIVATPHANSRYAFDPERDPDRESRRFKRPAASRPAFTPAAIFT